MKINAHILFILSSFPLAVITVFYKLLRLAVLSRFSLSLYYLDQGSLEVCTDHFSWKGLCLCDPSLPFLLEQEPTVFVTTAAPGSQIPT